MTDTRVERNNSGVAGGMRPLGLADRLALRPSEAATVLGISERTLRSMTSELPHIRRGSVLLYPVEGLREWLREEAKVEKARADAIADEIVQSMRDG